MRSWPRTRLAWLFPAVLAAVAASDPEVKQVRVASSKVSAWFPAGTEIEILPTSRFEELLRAARERPEQARPPRILRAHHAAKLEPSGSLSGRTELVFEPSVGSASALVVVDPWSPAIDRDQPGTELLRATTDGRLAVKIDATSPRTAEFSWRLQGRPGSEGRVFLLNLPDLEVASLTLDLPGGWVPEAQAGPRLGPEPGPTSDRALWRFEAARGSLNLRLHDPAEAEARPAEGGLWVEGTARFDLNQSPTNWRADWVLDASPEAPRILTIDLDAGLELVDVTGPRVASFVEKPLGDSTRLTINLSEASSGPSPLILRGICHVPAEGVWSIPSARPVNATWTGGRTIVALDESRALQSCIERAGRRLAPERSDSLILLFEGTGAVGPVAELTLKKPLADANLDVRGHLIVGDDVPRMSVALTWTVERGRLLSHSVDLSPGWTPDRVLTPASQPVPWHAEILTNGVTRLHIGPSLPDENALLLRLTLLASAPSVGVTGPLDLPRVRPTPGVRVVDEVWAATPDPRIALRPIRGDGLAWLDPLGPPFDDTPGPWVADDLRNALAWRWLDDGAEGRINRTLRGDRPVGEIKLDASIRNGRLGLAWSLAIESDLEDLRTIPIHLDQPLDEPIRWRSDEPGGPDVVVKSIDDARRAKLGFPVDGSAWDLQLSGPTHGRIVLEAKASRAWTGRGRVPILTLPGSYSFRGQATVIVDDSTRLKLDPRGLTPIDPAHLRDGTRPEPDPTPSETSRTRRAAVFGYQTTGGRLGVETIDPPAHAPRGLVREAFLVSQVFPGEGSRHRLSLRIPADSCRSIGLKLPEGAMIDRLRRDGQPISAVNLTGSAFQLDLPEAAGSRLDLSLTIDYRTASKLGETLLRPADFLPECSLPCLSFVWEVVAPEPWVVTDAVADLVETDPRPGRSTLTRLLGFQSNPWSRLDRDPSAETAPAVLAELDRLAADTTVGETTLGDWLVKLDAGPWPVVVDRLAVRSGGWGPTTRIGTLNLESKLSGPVKGVLQPLGLVAIPLGGMVVVTGKQEAPVASADRTAWTAAFNGVPWLGSDRSDRFQSAARWRGETTPRALAAGETLDRQSGATGWQTRRFVAPGWPPGTASVGLTNRRGDEALGWLVASAILTLGILARSIRPNRRALILFGLGMIASITLASTWPEPPSWATGWLRGTLAVAALWIGRSLRPSANLPRAVSIDGSTRNRQSGFLAGLARPTLVVAAALGGFTAASAAIVPPESSILALLVYDGPVDPSAKPDRVILSVRDANRLRQLGQPWPSPGPAQVSLASASHRIDRVEPNQATIESRYEVEVELLGEPGRLSATAEWSMPVGLARDLSTTVDDRSEPLRISDDGLLATVILQKPGRHVILFRRSLPIQEFGPDSGGIDLPVNRAAFAVVSVERDPVGRKVEVAATADLSGSMGPVRSIQVRWTTADRPADAGLDGPVEINALWNARPVGDLFRLRLTHSDSNGASALRLLVEPGLILRRHSIANLVNLRRGGTATRPEWILQFDPPLPKDTSIEVDFWRPARPETAERRWPLIELAAASKVNWALGFRRPADWSGRLESGPGVETTPEAALLKTWEPMPADGLTMAGAVRFKRLAPSGVVIQPVANRRTIDPGVQVNLEPGRLNLAIDATLTDRDGRSLDLEVGLPGELRLVRVEAAGLLDWQKSARDKLRLQFDGSEIADRRIRIEGYLPVPSDSVMTEARDYQTRIPWPRWVNVETLPGTLLVNGSTRFQVEAGEGVVALPGAGQMGSEPSFRASFRVAPGAGSSTIRWSAQPARLSVTVQSELAIDSASIEWTAVMTCDIAGGPADALYWNLPTEWARNASLEIEGSPHRLVAETRGSKRETTHWTIRPEAPLWGRVRLIVRSKRPVEPGVLFDYPEIAPLAAAGRGMVERYDVAIANLSDLEVKLEGIKGLQEIDPTRFRADESPGLRGSVDHAFQVAGGRWALGVRVGKSGELVTRRDDSRPTRVAAATITAVVAEDGQIWARGRFELAERPGAFLAFELAGANEIPWASVDGTIQRAIPDGPGRWLIPLGDGVARRVCLLWRREDSIDPALPTENLEIPRFGSSNPPMLVAVLGVPPGRISSQDQALVKVDRMEWGVASAEMAGSRIVDSLEVLDRTAPRERERLVEDIIEVELASRNLARSPASPSAIGRVAAVLARVEQSAANLELDDLFQEARDRAGLSNEPVDSSTAPRPNPSDLIRPRWIGPAAYFQSSGENRKGAASLTWTRSPRTTASAGLERWAIAAIGLMVSLVVCRWISRCRNGLRRHHRVLAILVLALATAWEPLGMVAILGLMAVGRKSS